MNQPRFPHGQRWYAHCKINQPTLIDTFLQDCPRHLSRSSTWAKARCPRRVPQPWVLGMKVMESIIRAQLYWITLKRKSELECILLLLAINQNQQWDCFVYLCNVWILLGIRFTRIYILDPIGKNVWKVQRSERTVSWSSACAVRQAVSIPLAAWRSGSQSWSCNICVSASWGVLMQGRSYWLSHNSNQQ